MLNKDLQTKGLKTHDFGPRKSSCWNATDFVLPASFKNTLHTIPSDQLQLILLHEELHVKFSQIREESLQRELQKESIILTDGYNLVQPNCAMSSSSKEDTIEVGDFVKVVDSIRSTIIGKVYKVSYVEPYDDGNVELLGIASEPYTISKHKVKLFKKKQPDILFTKPNIAGANCTGCGKFSEYNTGSYTCYECKNV